MIEKSSVLRVVGSLLVVAAWLTFVDRAASYDFTVEEDKPEPGKPVVDPFAAPPLKLVIRELDSPKDDTRLAATKYVLKRGKDALEPLRKAGAVQITPKFPARKVALRRIDMVYTLIDGLKPSKEKPSFYFPDRIGLEVKDGVAREDVERMGKKYGFRSVPSNSTSTKRRVVFMQLDPGKKLEDVTRKVLVHEPKVITVRPMYRHSDRCPAFEPRPVTPPNKKPPVKP